MAEGWQSLNRTDLNRVSETTRSQSQAGRGSSKLTSLSPLPPRSHSSHLRHTAGLQEKMAANGWSGGKPSGDRDRGKQRNGDQRAGTVLCGGSGYNDLTTDCDSDGVSGDYQESSMTPSQLHTITQMRSRTRPQPPPQETQVETSGASGGHDTLPSTAYSPPPPQLATGRFVAQSQPGEEVRGAEGGSGASNSVSASRLGIETKRPKFPHYATEFERRASFQWCSTTLCHSVGSYTEAGLFYAGYEENEDRVRCFYCGGGLKNWDPRDDPWVEHARFWPACPFVCSVKKQPFVNAVRTLAEKAESLPIQPSDVEAEMRRQAPQSNDQYAQYDGAQAQWDQVAEEDQSKSDDEIRKKLEELQRENERLREVHRCKVCLDKEVCILFLPCGHLVSCANCAPAVPHCPFCRCAVKGSLHMPPQD